MTTRGLTMTTPTSQQDELEQWLLTAEGVRHTMKLVPQSQRELFALEMAKHLAPLIDRTVAERVLAIIGEDDEEPYDEGSRFWQKIRNRNELRAELRAAVQKGQDND